jgi:cell division protein FtsL
MERDYVVRARVRNQAIVREVDEQRQRELFRLVWLGAAVLVCVLFTAWQHHVHWRLEARHAALQAQRAAALQVNRHLQLELASLSAPDRIEHIAVNQLRMQVPDRRTAVVVERVLSAPSPAPSVVAAR